MFLPGDLDWRVLVLSAGVCLISTLLFGLVPAFQTSKIDLASALKAESGGVVGGKRRALVRSSLVVVQVALSFVLLAGAGLLLQSLRAVQNTSPGFTTSVLVLVGIPPTVAEITVVPGCVNDAVALPLASIVATVVSLDV